MESKILPIVGYGSQILREVCVEAENKPETLILVDNLICTMKSIGTAVGLASNQINSNLRVFTMNLYGKITVVINPRIIKSRGSKPSVESCLSIPNLSNVVAERNDIIEVEFYDSNFNKQKQKLNGFEAIVFQHEIHHLDGIFYTDLLTEEGKEAVKDKLSDIAKGLYQRVDYEMIFTHLLQDSSQIVT